MKTVIDLAPGKQGVFAIEDGNLITGTVQDCMPIREFAQAKHKAGDFGSSDFKHAAKLPDYAIEAYCNVNGITFQEFMQNPAHIKAMCNDPDLRDFRIWPGRV
jgi:hypothetical protein